MMNTHVRPVRDLKNKYPELADIIRNLDHVIITNNGKSESVLIGFEEFKKYEEFCTYRGNYVINMSYEIFWHIICFISA